MLIEANALPNTNDHVLFSAELCEVCVTGKSGERRENCGWKMSQSNGNSYQAATQERSQYTHLWIL